MKRSWLTFKIVAPLVLMLMTPLLSLASPAEEPSDYSGGIVDEVSADKITLIRGDGDEGLEEKQTFLITLKTIFQTPQNYSIKTGDDVVVGFRNDGATSTALNILLVEKSTDIEHDAYAELHGHHKKALLSYLKDDLRQASATLSQAALALRELVKAGLDAQGREVVESAEGLDRLSEEIKKEETSDVKKLDEVFTQAKRSLKKRVLGHE